MMHSPGEPDHAVIHTSLATERTARVVTHPPPSLNPAEPGRGSALTNRGESGGGPPAGCGGTVGFRDATGSPLVTAPSATTADTHKISGLSAIRGGSATYWERLMTIEGKAVLVTGAN